MSEASVIEDLRSGSWTQPVKEGLLEALNLSQHCWRHCHLSGLVMGQAVLLVLQVSYCESTQS